MAAKRSHLPIALTVDLILVILFTIIGHYTHSHTFDPTGLWSTAWPFLAGLVLAWLLGAVWDRPVSPLHTGGAVWAITVLTALVIRALTGQGTAGAFIVVAASLNLLTLVGWRVVAAALTKSGR
ncbi:DUF3054 family protein [Brevibacterium sanguinis]|uniref:DUF3054 family protein n=2 Tax=Brevibacterium TaxID=1696 RepID=A0A366IIH3_9MICO|nr:MULTISPECIES: DUF3054 domain-containing protein [Brevibacterium]RBP64694.1 DUF3054 family protein [Brevibacterium sanguinis]RBP71663.1 DUF3054 family protein [Brevibacterium celere]